MSRPSIDEYFLNIAKVVATRGTCARRKVGAVLVDHRKHILATGYNGPPVGMMNCTEVPCAGAKMASGTGLDSCQAVHAEANALLQCSSPHEIKTLYCTTSPCIHCVKMLLNTSCTEIVFLEQYSHTDSKWLWENSKRMWFHWQSTD